MHTIETIQTNYNKRRRRSTLPLSAVRVLRVHADQSVQFWMNGRQWITAFAWTGLEPITTGNTRTAKESERIFQIVDPPAASYIPNECSDLDWRTDGRSIRFHDVAVADLIYDGDERAAERAALIVRLLKEHESRAFPTQPEIPPQPTTLELFRELIAALDIYTDPEIKGDKLAVFSRIIAATSFCREALKRETAFAKLSQVSDAEERAAYLNDNGK